MPVTVEKQQRTENYDSVLTKCKCQILNLKQYIVITDLLSNLTETQAVKDFKSRSMMLNRSLRDKKSDMIALEPAESWKIVLQKEPNYHVLNSRSIKFSIILNIAESTIILTTINVLAFTHTTFK